MEHRKLRDCFGLFSTGIIIACGRRRNFLAEKFAIEKIFDQQVIIQKILNNKIISKTVSDSRLAKTILDKLKKIFTDEFFGMTINSFASVSLEPPLVLFSIDNKSSNLQFFKKNHYFSLNILGEGQTNLAKAFATPKNSTKWGVEPYFLGKFGNPIFQNSIGFLECKKQRVIRAGDHHIILAEVVDFDKLSEDKPLLYVKGKFVS